MSIWAGSQLLVSINPSSYESLIHWQTRVLVYLHLNNSLSYLIYAALIAAAVSLIFLFFETAIALYLNEDIRIRLGKNDYLLPVTRMQKWRALGIIGIGAFIEEILFRAYLFQALLPIWDNWLWAALLVSAIFALVHTNLQGLSASIWIFITSMLLLSILIYTSSLLFAVTIHFFINFFNIFIIPKGIQKLL